MVWVGARWGCEGGWCAGFENAPHPPVASHLHASWTPEPFQGWLPRTGLQYGADFVLYHRHPAVAHSDYTVLVVPLTPGVRPPMEWHSVQIANRLSAQVRRQWRRGCQRLVLCGVGGGCTLAGLVRTAAFQRQSAPTLPLHPDWARPSSLWRAPPPNNLHTFHPPGQQTSAPAVRARPGC